VAKISAKKAPHHVAIGRINAKAEQLHEQLSLEKQEHKIMEKVLGLVHSRERVNLGWREKQGSLKLLDGLRTVEMRGLSRLLVVVRLREKCRCLGKSYKKNPRGGILSLMSPRNCPEFTRYKRMILQSPNERKRCPESLRKHLKQGRRDETKMRRASGGLKKTVMGNLQNELGPDHRLNS